MKKLKIFLFGIVSILGIGCSFGTYRQNDVDYNIGFYVKNLEFISDYGYGYFSVNSTNDGLNFNTGSNFYYSNCGNPDNCSDSDIFGINSAGNGSSSVLRDSRFYYGNGFYSIYTFNGSVGTIFNMLNSSNYSVSQSISPTAGTFANSIDYYYTRLFLDSSNTSQNGFASWLTSGSTWGNMTAQKYQIFSSSFSSQVIRSDGLKYDCLLLSGTDIVECSKNFISAGFVDGYSFAINQNGIVNFRSVLNGFADSYSYFIESGENQYQSGYTLDGVYIMKLNNFGVIDTGNYIMAMALDGDILNFSLYNCPNNSLSIENCLFIKGGNLTNSFSSSDFKSFIFAPHYVYNGGFHGNSFHIINYYNSDTSKLYLYRGTAFNSYLEYGFNGFSSFTLNLLQSSDNPNILNRFIDYSPDSGNGNQSTSNVNSNSLYYNCLGPTYSTPDGLPPKYCFNSSGEFQGDFLKNCYVSFDGLDQYVYCYNDGFQQEVEFVENGSGYDIVACDGCSTNVLDWLNDGYSTGYFENFLNTTGYFFRCPFPYSESLTVWPKLISMMNGFDINLPINCAFAGFSQGKLVFTFEHSGHLIQGGPLLNFEGDNRKLLYKFFDFLIILGLLFFFGKILKFFS